MLSNQVKVYVGLLVVCSILMGIVGNVLVITVIVFTKKLREQSVFLLAANLALFALALDVFPMPMFGVYALNDWPQWSFGAEACRAAHFTGELCVTAGVLGLWLVSLVQYLGVARWKHVQRTVLLVWVATTWVLAACVHAPLALHADVNNGTCKSISGFAPNPVYGYVVGGRLVVVFLTTVGFLYTAIYYRNLKPGDLKTSLRKGWNESKLMMTVSSLCVVFWLPLWTITLAQINNVPIKDKLSVISTSISHFGSVITPLALLMFSKTFRQSLLQLTNCLKQSKKTERKCAKDSLKLPLTQFDESDGTKTQFLRRSYTLGKKVEIDDLCDAFLDSKQHSGKRNLSFDGNEELEAIIYNSEM